MRARSYKLGFLGTRVGRQTLAQFLAAALLPVLVVSVVGVWAVRRSLENEATARVQRAAKTSSVAILGELAAAARGLDESGASDAPHVVLRVVRDSQRVAGAPVDATIELRWDLPDGRQVLRTVPPEVLWWRLDQEVDAQRTQVCIFDIATWTRIHCTPATAVSDEQRLRAAAIDAMGPDPDSPSGDLLFAHRDLFLRFEFGTSDWRLVATEDRRQALAPAETVTWTLSLLAALAIVSAFTFAHQQIRRSTVPLQALRDTTRRIVEGDLRAQVQITSRDEYGELGRSFNIMTNSLARQLTLLTRMESVDTAALREHRVESVVQMALVALADTPRWRGASIAIVENESAGVMVRWTANGPNGLPDRDEVRIDARSRAAWMANPRQLILEGTETAPSQVELPLLLGEQLLGVVMLAVDPASQSAAEDTLAARRIADRVTAGVANVQLVDRLDALSSGTLRAFANAIDANSAWTAGHSERVTSLALRLGRELALTAGEMSTLYRGGLMHDIGKIGLPTALLDKPGRLDPTERAMIERHPVIGEQILKPLAVFDDALCIVRSHHEKFDGTGYPDGLAGEAIPWLARVLAVADVFDALASDRPYRAGLTSRAVVTIIEDGAGTHFDPRVVQALLSLQATGALEDAGLASIAAATSILQATGVRTSALMAA